FALLIAVELRTSAQLERLTAVVLLTSLPVAWYGILQMRGWDPTGLGVPYGRAHSSIGNPIWFGAYLVTVIPLAAWRLARAGRGGRRGRGGAGAGDRGRSALAASPALAGGGGSGRGLGRLRGGGQSSRLAAERAHQRPGDRAAAGFPDGGTAAGRRPLRHLGCGPAADRGAAGRRRQRRRAAGGAEAVRRLRPRHLRRHLPAD